MVILSRQAFALYTVMGELQRTGGSQVYLHKVIKPADFTETFIVSQHNKLSKVYK